MTSYRRLTSRSSGPRLAARAVQPARPPTQHSAAPRRTRGANVAAAERQDVRRCNYFVGELMTIDFAGCYRAEHLTDVETLIARAYHKDPPWTRWGCLGLSALMTLAFTAAAASGRSTLGAAEWALLGTVATAYYAWQVVRARRALQSNPIVGLNAFGQVSDRGISITVSGNAVMWAWADLLACRETPRSIVLFLNKREHFLLPSEFFASPAEFEVAARRCRESIPRRRPIPLVNWKSLLVTAILLLAAMVLLIILGRA